MLRRRLFVKKCAKKCFQRPSGLGLGWRRSCAGGREERTAETEEEDLPGAVDEHLFAVLPQ